MAPKPDRPAIIFGMVAKLFAKATTKFGLATTNLPTAIEQRCRCPLDHRSRVARFSRLTRWSPEMKTLLLIADAGSVPTPQFAAEKHWCSYVSRQARDANSWIYVPVGTCTKIAGGSLKKA